MKNHDELNTETTRKASLSAPNSDDETQLLPAISGQNPSVRELPSKNSDVMHRHQTHRKKWIAVFGVFIFAILSGFFISDSIHEKYQINENEALHKIQSVREQEAELQKKQEVLNQEKQRIEQEKQKLERRKKELERATEEAQKRNEDIKKKRDHTSELNKVWDKITGKEHKRKEEEKKNLQIYTDAKNELEKLENAIRSSSERIREVDETLRNLQKLHETLEAEIIMAYKNHSDMISRVYDYIRKGINYIDAH